MKKMMIVAALALMTGVAQAGVVKWGLGNIKDPLNTAVNLASGKNVYVQIFVSTQAASQVGDMTGTSAVAGSYDLTSAGVKSAAQLYTAVDAKAARDAAGTAPNLNLYAVIYYNTTIGATVSSIENATHYWVSTVQSKTMANIDSMDTTYTFTGSTTMVWTAVPEPTSMALLAIGGAVFGLRRKFKKA